MQLTPLVTFLPLFVNLITCDRLTGVAEIPHQEEETVLNDLVLLIDYLQLVQIRFKILQHFINDHLCFVGPSLAYVGQMMLIKDEFLPYPTDRTIFLLPFSGNFFQINNSPNSSDNFIMVRENLPTWEELEYYKIYLRGFGLDPRNIVDRHSRTGRRTVIIKKIKDSVGLMSFLYILLDWAEKEGIRPFQMRDALKVFVVTLNIDEDQISPFLTVRGCTIDVISMNADSIADTIQRIAYPERNTGYVGLVPYYPPRLWNYPPEFDREHLRRRSVIIERLTELIQMVTEALATTSPTTTPPTLVLRNDACPRRSERSLSAHNFLVKNLYLVLTFNTTGPEILNKNILNDLQIEYAKSSNETSFDEFFEDQLKNSSSYVGKLLNQTCHDYSGSIDEEQVHFSPHKTWISRCMKRHRLLHCNETYDSAGIVKEIASSVSKSFSGKIKTKKSVSFEVEILVHLLSDSYPKLPVDFVIEATKQAALYCSNEKIMSTLECPVDDLQYLGDVMTAWFAESSQKNIEPRTKELQKKKEKKVVQQTDANVGRD